MTEVLEIETALLQLLRSEEWRIARWLLEDLEEEMATNRQTLTSRRHPCRFPTMLRADAAALERKFFQIWC